VLSFRFEEGDLDEPEGGKSEEGRTLQQRSSFSSSTRDREVFQSSHRFLFIIHWLRREDWGEVFAFLGVVAVEFRARSLEGEGRGEGSASSFFVLLGGRDSFLALSVGDKVGEDDLFLT